MSKFPPDPAVGHVTLVGAGPGDPELLTVKAVRAIAAAEVILFDRLVGPEILALASPDAERIDVGKRCGHHSMSQTEINQLIVLHALRGRYVVRLKGGDPFIFGRGGEELQALREAGIPVSVIPGVTAASAAAASLAMPLTQRHVGRTLHLVSGHGCEGGGDDHDWAALARPDATVVLYMGVRRLRRITDRMIAAGIPDTLPAVAIEHATLPMERQRIGTVATIAAFVEEAGFDGPTLVIFGEVARAARIMSPNSAMSAEVTE